MRTDPFRQTFEAVPEAQLLLDRDALVLAVSDAYLRAMGLTRAAVVGNLLFELPPYRDSPADTAQLQHLLGAMTRSAVPVSNHFADVVPAAPGNRFTHGSSVPILDRAGAVDLVIHRLESQLGSEATESDGERRLRKLIECSLDGVVLLDARLNLTYATPSIESVWGYTPQESLLRSPMSDIHPDDAPGLGMAVRTLLEQPGGLQVQTIRLLHRDGSWRSVELRAANYLHDPDVNAIVATFRDITVAVAMEDALRRSRDHLTVALSAARALSWERNLVTQETTYSTDLASYFVLPERTGKSLDAIETIHPDDREMVKRALLRSIETGGAFELAFRGVDRGSETRYYASRGELIRDAKGNALRHVGVTWDITETHRLQEERRSLEQRMQEGQKLESLGVLAGGIAHDFNNLLTAITGTASLMRREDLGGTSLSYLQRIEDASRQAADLCRQMLAYAGKGRFVLTRTSLNDVITDIVHLLQVSISKKAELRVRLDEGLPPIVADITQIRQVLMNLVINASDSMSAASDRGGVISISTGLVRAHRAYLDQTFLAPELPEGSYAYLEVSDTGSGMSPETQAHIFEPFFSTKAPGRGLGLAVVLGIVRGHKGALKLDSELGKGSTFRLLLPVEGDANEIDPPVARDAPRYSGGGTVLVVEDEAVLRAIVCQMVEALGMRTLRAAHGREALNVYREHQRQIVGVLMDLSMPTMDGEEAFGELRRIDPNVPVLLMSGYNEQDAIARFVGKGLAGFIQKPFTMEELDQQLSALLASKAPR